MIGLGMMNMNGMGMMGMGGGILQRAMSMVGGGMNISAGLNLPGLSMGMSLGAGFGMDSTSFSPDAMMGGRSNFSHPLLGMGGGMGMPQCGMGNGMGMIPGMMPGMGGMGQMGGMGGNRQMMMMMMQMMKMMMQMMQRGGCGGGMPMGRGMPGMGGPGGCGGGMNPMGQMMNGMGQMMKGMGNMMQGMGRMMGSGGMRGPGMCPGMGGMQGAGRGQGGGRVVELQKGQSFTTPGGCSISWKGNTVNVKEPGGRQKQMGAGGAAAGMGAGMAFAGAFAGVGQNGAFAGAFIGVGGAAGCGGMGGCGGAGKYQKPNNWKVWGDPHIKDGKGKQQDFKTNNSMFTLRDGSRVAMCAAGPKGVVNRVRIFLPGTPVNKRTLGGINPNKTTVYQNQGLGKKAAGTLDQYMGMGGMGMSPFGNMMF